MAAAFLYRDEAAKRDTLETYGRGTPDDWLERNVYTPHSARPILMHARDRPRPVRVPRHRDLLVQIAWIPFWAAGVINGVGHYLGYRNFETEDASRNIVPIGILIGGEEFHNNHHAYGSSAKLANEWWELDIGWVYICALEALGLASVKKVSPRVSFSRASSGIDVDTLRAVVLNRFHVLKLYGRRVLSPVLHGENGDSAGFTRRQLDRVRRLMIREDADAQLRADPHTRQWLEAALERSPKLRTVYQFMQQLRTLCGRNHRQERRRPQAPASLVRRRRSQRHSRPARIRVAAAGVHHAAGITRRRAQRALAPSGCKRSPATKIRGPGSAMSLTEIVGAACVAALVTVLLIGASRAQSSDDPAAHLAALETELGRLEHEIGIIEDTKAIKRLQRAYGYYVDKKLSREIGTLFADDPATTTPSLGAWVCMSGRRG